jgi:uncharacterized membrane protein (DUF485 family)
MPSGVDRTAASPAGIRVSGDLTVPARHVVLAGYAHGFMATKVLGKINMGLVLGLLQFASTFVIAGWYVRFVSRRVDPAAERIGARIGEDA